jgi:ribosomal protein L29
MAKELKNKTEKELKKALNEAREDVRKFRFSLAGSGKMSLKEIRAKKTQIAQILTELRSRELAEMNK